MSLNSRAIINAVVSHAMTLGVFDRVAGHEPDNKPGNGLTCAVWVDRIEPIGKVSGLGVGSGRVVLNVRVFNPLISEPADEIDLNMVDAIDALFDAYAGDFTLGGLIRNVDFFGETGPGLHVQAGYIETEDETVFRVMNISLPMIVNDIWEFSP
jgi:hypothetical protein